MSDRNIGQYWGPYSVEREERRILYIKGIIKTVSTNNYPIIRSNYKGYFCIFSKVLIEIRDKVGSRSTQNNSFMFFQHVM